MEKVLVSQTAFDKLALKVAMENGMTVEEATDAIRSVIDVYPEYKPEPKEKWSLVPNRSDRRKKR